MARDSPALLASSELRDLDLQPTAVRAVKPTIIHPQLRDLILPLERGKVLYPRGKSLEQHTWNSTGHEPARELEQWMHDDPTGTTRTFVSLTFTPNCLTASRGIIACGGQHGELYMSHLPDEEGKGDDVDVRMRNNAQVPLIRPFSISTTLPTRAINNSLLILPDYPSGWSQRNKTHRAGYIGRRGRQWTVEEHEDGEADRVDGQARRESASSSRRFPSFRATPDEEDEDEDEDEDAMDVDSDTEEDDAPLESPPFATYPNTVTFLHAPRIPRLSSSQVDSPSARRRSSASAARSTPPCPPVEARSVRAGSLSNRRGSSRYAPEPVIVTSLPHASSSRSASMTSAQRPVVKDGLGDVAGPSKGKRAVREDPRFLVSNNDQSIKMFSLRRTEPAVSSDRGETSRWSARPSSSVQHAISDRRREWLLERDVVPPAPFRLGAGYDSWTSIGINEGLRALDPQDALHDLSRMEERYPQPEATIAPSEMRLRRSVQDFETTLGMRSTAHPPSSTGQSLSATIARAQADVAMTERRGATLMGLATMREKEREERKLLKVGGSSFSYAINHSAISPDLKYMVSVGDSPDVHLFEVVGGGREFRPVAVYKAATDAGFSTAWSKDGRKFAVASQDGQVTVWDHRSSHPLALFYTSHHTPIPRGSSPPDIDSEPERPVSPGLVDPVTNSYRTSRSTSGREAARVVKFSPEGSARDLMVFSEENTHIHVVDAKTLTSHVVLRVPVDAISPHVPRTCHQQHGFDAGTWGISGLAFDPTGDWLYAGTERTVVEWDMRRATGGAAEPGVWEMA